ncbi:MAG TPA: YlcI/YnfO family protein [Streptosporangiaceae bacterium]|nr:YlcI/YnfO family protein [Streptosporangiaceae bacterium]
MATKKVTVTLPTDLIELVNEAAIKAGVPVSRFVSSALERELRRRIGLALVAEWEAEHGAFTPAEMAEARAIMAAADAEYLAQTERTA